jgi:hypothetical protein
MKSTSQFFKTRWTNLGWRFVAGLLGGGLAVFAIYLAEAIAKTAGAA